MKTCNIVVEPAKRRAVLDVFGAATIPCIIEAFSGLVDDADWDSDFNILILVGDGPSLETFTLSALEALQAFMLEWNAANRTGAQPRTAIVCPNDLKRVIVELWAAMNDTNQWQVEIGAFIGRDEAAAWLAQMPADQDA